MEAGITEEGCVLKEAHGFGFRREYHYVTIEYRIAVVISVQKMQLMTQHPLPIQKY